MDFFARSYSILGAREAFVVREVHVDLSIAFSLQENHHDEQGSDQVQTVPRTESESHRGINTAF